MVAAGAKKLRNIQSIRYEGKFDNSYLKDFVLSKKIDKKALYPEFELSVINNQAYSLQIDGAFGNEAYTFSWGNYWRDQGAIPPEQWSPSNIDRLKIQLFLDIDGFLFRWKENGFLLKKQDDVSIENCIYHCIRLITTEKDTVFYYINPESYLISKISFFRELVKHHNSPSYTYTNYKKIRGIQIPFSMVYKTQMFKGPNGYQEIKIKHVKLNPKLNKEIFSLEHRITKLKTN